VGAVAGCVQSHKESEMLKKEYGAGIINDLEVKLSIPF
jgi:hypothetical protein